MRSLSVRLPLLAAAVLAISVLLAIGIAYQLLVVTGQGELDRSLLRERDRFEHTLSRTLTSEAAGPEGLPVRRAAAEYLAAHPTTESYLVVIRIGGDVLSAAGGPEVLVALRDRGGLPVGPLGEVATIPTEAGPVRTMSSRVRVDAEDSAILQVIAPLEPIRQQALAEIRRLAVAGGLSVLVGCLVLAVVLRRALAPLRAVAGATRAIELDDPARVRFPQSLAADEVGELAAELNRMLDRLDSAMRSRRELFAATSHELRTPITIALGSIDTFALGDRTDADAVDQTLATVRHELVGMGRLVDDLMALARAETEDFVHPETLDLVEFFDDLRLRAAGLRMQGLSFGTVPDTQVMADPGRLGQAVLNLVVNAQVHNPPGTAASVSAQLRGDSVAILVRDLGQGIHPDVRSRVREPFARAPSDAATPSTGLGLAVVEAIMRAHGGTVEIDTGPEGTTVALLVPGARPVAPAPPQTG